MTDDIGVTKSRVFREAYEAGKKLPKVAEFIETLDHYIAVTKVILPGAKKSTTLVEIHPYDLERLVVEIRQEEIDVRKKLLAKKTRLKTQKIKDQKQLIASQAAAIITRDEQLQLLRDTVKQMQKRLKKVEKELLETETANNNALERADLLEARNNEYREEGKDQKKSIQGLKEELELLRSKNEKLHYNNGVLMRNIETMGDVDEERAPMRSATDVLRESTTRIRGNKPYPGSHPG